MTTQQIIVDVIQPGPWIATNDRTHWRVRNDATRTWREAAAVYARRGRHAPIAGPFSVHATIHKTTHQVFDLDGVTPTVKACIDGLRDAKVIVDDDRRWMRGFAVSDGGPREHGGVVITLTPLELTTTPTIREAMNP